MNIRNQIDPALLEYIEKVLKVCSSRAAYVINHILIHGSITSEDIRKEGYVHGARAVGDVRDNGIPLLTKKTKSSDNRTIAEYFLGSINDVKRHKFGGRINFPSSLKKQLIEKSGLLCNISQQKLPENDLQIDHRIPFYIAGDIAGERNLNDFMLLSKSIQRTKSWDCENCKNVKEDFDPDICKSCYWAFPENYTHIAMKKIRTVNITWENEEITNFDTMKTKCDKDGITVQNYIKNLIRDEL